MKILKIDECVDCLILSAELVGSFEQNPKTIIVGGVLFCKHSYNQKEKEIYYRNE